MRRCWYQCSMATMPIMRPAWASLRALIKNAACGAPSLVEVYSALTRMPGKYRVSGNPAMLFIGNIRERLTVVGLAPEEYFVMLESNAALGIAGGAIYDALLAGCALKSGARQPSILGTCVSTGSWGRR